MPAVPDVRSVAVRIIMRSIVFTNMFSVRSFCLLESVGLIAFTRGRLRGFKAQDVAREATDGLGRGRKVVRFLTTGIDKSTAVAY